MGTAGQRAGPGTDRIGPAAESVAETLAITAGGYFTGENARVVSCLVHDLPACNALVAPRRSALAPGHEIS